MTTRRSKKGTGRKSRAGGTPKTSSASAAGDGKTPAAEGPREGAKKTDTAKSAEAATEVPEAKPAGKKTTLPAFGFAEDLLKHRRRAAGSEKGKGSSSRTGGKEEEAAGPPAPAPPAEAVAAAELDENRIFRFADSLEIGSGDESEARATPRRIETCLTLTLAGETFAMPVKPVREVLRLSTITRVPHAPHPIRGVTNVRGRVLPVIDLRRRIELPEGEITRSSRIVVVTSRGRLLGLLVDAVHQVVHLDLNLVQPPPDDVMTFKSDYISGVYHLGEQLVLLLDVDRSLIVREIAPDGPGERAAVSGAA